MSAHDANVLGALALALADRLAAASPPEASGSAAQALVRLYGRGAGGAIDALAGVLGLSHSGTVRVVDRLQAEGLLERRRGADQRSAALHLTPRGRRAARRILANRAAAMESVLSLLTADQQAEMCRLAGRILEQLGEVPGAEPRLCRLCDLEACGRTRGACPVAPRRRRSPA
jgi:MarR family transcriptional regulator, negative regulator of the multidrug operon emrRAB